MNQQLDESLERLERVIQDLRRALKSSDSDFNLFSLIDQFKLQLDTLLLGFSTLEVDHELEQTRQVLLIVARFVHQEIDGANNSLDTCFLAVCSLCGETDVRITEISGKPPQLQQVNRVFAAAREHIPLIKVHYERVSDTRYCKRETEIFSIRTGDQRPRVRRIEEEIPWDTLTADIRDSFLRESKQKVSYQIYPPQE